MEGPADVVTVLDSYVPAVCYSVHGADSGDVLATRENINTAESNTNTDIHCKNTLQKKKHVNNCILLRESHYNCTKFTNITSKSK